MDNVSFSDEPDRAIYSIPANFPINHTPLGLFPNQRSAHQLALSPGQPETGGLSWPRSPMSPATTLQPAVSQPGPIRMQADYFPPVTAYGQPMVDYAFDGSFANK